MAFLIYFIAGVAVGAIATYIYKDDKTCQKLTDTGNRFKNGVNVFMESFRQTPEEQTAQPAPQILKIKLNPLGSAQRMIPRQ